MWQGDIIDICKGVVAIFTDALAVPVKMGRKDERADNDPSFPTGVLTVIDYRKDSARQSGLTHVYSGDGANGTLQRSKVPIPMNLYMQLDTVTFTRTEDYRLMMAAQSLLQQRHIKITTPNGEVLYLIPYQQDALDSTIDNMWRKIYRFYVETWLEPYGETETVPTLKTIVLALNEITVDIPSPWCVRPNPCTLVGTGANPTVNIA